MQNNSREKFVQEWLKRAEDDELNARSVLKHRDGTPANVCFLSQQMVEKLLKALLLFRAGDYPKTHDLNQMATLLGKYYDPALENLKEEIVLLNSYYVGTRYPADIPIESFVWEMAEEAFEAALKIKEFVLNKLK